MLHNIRPVLLCGGMGRRLAPLSTPEKPKPFLSLLSDRSMLQQTLLRVRQTKAPAILCNQKHVPLVNADLQEISALADVIIKEPASRNTGPAIALATKYYQEGEEVLLFLPCDHKIENVTAFHDALCTSYSAAKQGHLILFAERPTTPDNGYGYIQTQGSGDILEVQKFHEKPDVKTATEYIQRGFFWNTGIIMVRSDILARAFELYSPSIWDITQELDPSHIDAAIFLKMPSISIDYALLEQMNHKKACAVSMGWSDIGTLDRLRASA